jgi:hypothetical protein
MGQRRDEAPGAKAGNVSCRPCADGQGADTPNGFVPASLSTCKCSR